MFTTAWAPVKMDLYSLYVIILIHTMPLRNVFPEIFIMYKFLAINKYCSTRFIFVTAKNQNINLNNELKKHVVCKTMN